MENENFGLSPRSDSGWYYQQMREHNPEQWDALIQSDLEVLRSLREETAFDFDPNCDYSVCAINGGVGVEQFGQVFFVGNSYDDVKYWLAANDPNWQEVPEPTGNEWDDGYQLLDLPEEFY